MPASGATKTPDPEFLLSCITSATSRQVQHVSCVTSAHQETKSLRPAGSSAYLGPESLLSPPNCLRRTQKAQRITRETSESAIRI
jgi:hypothetical protein